MLLRELDANLVVVFDALLIDVSVTKAAARLGRSPSAVSHALANLREVFADDLFVRAGQQLVPTTRAQQLAPTIHIIVSGMESLLRSTDPFDPAKQEQEFSITCNDASELTLVFQLRQQLKSAAPGISLSWRAMNADRIVDDLRAGLTHFVILESEPDETLGDICWQSLGSERLITLVKSGHELTKIEKATKSNFANYPHIFVGQTSGLGELVRSHLKKQKVKITDEIIVSSWFSGLLLAGQSDSLIMVPESVAVALATAVNLVPIREPFPKLRVEKYLVWHKSQDRDECHRWLLDEIVKVETGPADTDN